MESDRLTSVDPLPTSSSTGQITNRLLDAPSDLESNRAVSPPPSILLTHCEANDQSTSDGELVEQQNQRTQSSVQPRPNSADFTTNTGSTINYHKIKQQQSNGGPSGSTNAANSASPITTTDVQLLQPISADDSLRFRSNSEGNKFGKRGNFTLSSIIRRSLFAGQEAVSCPVTPQHPPEIGGGSVSGSPQLGRAMLGHAKPMAKSLSNKMRGMISKGKHQLAIARSYSLEGGKFIAKKKGGSASGSQSKLPFSSVGPFFDEYRFLPLKWSISTFYDPTCKDLDHRQIYIKFFRFYRCYDLVPTSAKLVVFDTQLLVKKAFAGLVTHGVKAAPLWDSRNQRFVGMLTITFFINILIDLHREKVAQPEELEEQKLEHWQRFFVSANVNETVGSDAIKTTTNTTSTPPSLISIDPDSSIYDAVQLLLLNKIHRLPILDPLTSNVIYVITHKRILKFLFLYYSYLPSPEFLERSIEDLEIGTYGQVETLTPETSVLEALNKFVARKISSLPIVDSKGKLLDLFCKFDLFHLAANKMYSDLEISIKKALEQREDSKGEPLVTCYRSHTLHQVIESFVQTETHRLIVINEKDLVLGVVSLSDMLKFFCSNKPISCLMQKECSELAANSGTSSADTITTSPSTTSTSAMVVASSSSATSVDKPDSKTSKSSKSRAKSDSLPKNVTSESSSKKKSHKSFGRKSFKNSICQSKYRQNVIEETNEES